MKRKKGRSAKKAASGNIAQSEEDFKKSPHTFVIPRGHVGKNINELIRDMRRVMEPYTASRLKVRKKNVLKDFISIAGALNVSHLMTFTKTDIATNMRLMRLPRGPTLTFKVNNYSLVKDIVSIVKKHNMDPKQFNHHPLIVLNNFSGEGMHMKLMAAMFQNMFPSINVNRVKLREIHRCVLINYNSDDQTLDFRHYNVKAVPMGLSKGVKKLQRAQIPDMSKYEDVSDFLLKDGNLSESEAEMDGPHNEVILPQNVAGRGNLQSSKSAIRLTEIGPRLKLELVKIEEGVCDGEVMYHKFVEKTPEEIEQLKTMRHKKRSLKEQRKKKQEENIENKKKHKEEMKQKCLRGMKKEDNDSDIEAPESKVANASDDEDDVDYFRQEVGDEPDADMMIARKKRKHKFEDNPKFSKRQRFEKPQKRGNNERTESPHFSRKTKPGFAKPKSKQNIDTKTVDKNNKGNKKQIRSDKPRTIQDELVQRKKRKMHKMKVQQAKRAKGKAKKKKVPTATLR